MATCVPSRRGLAAIFAGIIAAIVAVDYARFDHAVRALNTAASTMGGSPHSIGGWPFGRECVLRFDRPLNDDELHRLAAAIPRTRRNYMQAYFACAISPDAEARVRTILPNDRVSIAIRPAAAERAAGE